MPNPFSSLARVQVTSKNAPERPEAIPPVPEHPAGDNNPYRGTESHGVAAVNKPSPTQGDWDTQEGRTYLPAEQEYEPIPVRIVQEHGNEFRQFRVHKFTILGVTMILPRNLSRISARLRNSGNEVLYLGSDANVVDYLAYTLNAANPTLDIRTQDAVYITNIGGVAGPAGQIEIYEEYAVEI